MRAYFAEEHLIKRDGIAVRRLRTQRAPGTAGQEAAAERRERNVSRDEKDLSREIGGSMGIRRAERCFKLGEHQIDCPPMRFKHGHTCVLVTIDRLDSLCSRHSV